MQKKLKTDNHTILKYNRSEQHKNQIDNLNTHFAWKKSSWMMIRSKRVRFYFETWRVQTDVRLGWFTRPLHPTTALVSFKPILHACREFGRFFRYLVILHSNSGFENILHIQVTSNHYSCEFQTHLICREFGTPFGRIWRYLMWPCYIQILVLRISKF